MRAARVLAAAFVAVAVTGCTPLVGGAGAPPPATAEVGDVGLPAVADNPRAQWSDTLELPFPGGTLRVATGGPAVTLVPPLDAADLRDRPVEEGAEVRDIDWRVVPEESLSRVLGEVSGDAALGVRAGDLLVPLRSPFPGVDHVGSGSAGVVVPEGAELAFVVRLAEGTTLTLPLDGPHRGDAGVVAGLRDGLTVTEGRCRVLDHDAVPEYNPPDPTRPLLEAAVVDSPWWPGLGLAAPGRTWRGVRVLGAFGRLDPDDLVETSALTLAGGRPVTDRADPTPFTRSTSSTSAVFDVPAGGATADLTVVSADGDVTATCRPPAVVPLPR
ncbi:hypothetical protein [Nocardioides litoris]|uniref:hypothetical protein n=1 Tax=Nocardioides litoris TaxID=1926648 RepID=UPI0011209479|nr:hypothetical protein [Nocardioides litoris]